MKITKVAYNNRKKAFVLETDKAQFEYPYSKLNLKPSKTNKIKKLYIDRELGNRGFTYELDSGKEDSILLDQVLEYNKDPEYLSQMFLYKFSLYANKLTDKKNIRKREISRRMNTSPTQIYRLLKPENKNKTIDQMIKLLTALDCPIKIMVPGITKNGIVDTKHWHRLLSGQAV